MNKERKTITDIINKLDYKKNKKIYVCFVIKEYDKKSLYYSFNTTYIVVNDNYRLD